MMYRRTLLAATALLLLPACDQAMPTEPAPGAEIAVGEIELTDPFEGLLGTPDMAVEDLTRVLDPMQSARGHGDVEIVMKQVFPYGFSFTARREGELTKLDDAKGEFEYYTVDPKSRLQVRIHADVTCLSVTARGATIGGVIKRSDSKLKELQPGMGVVFSAFDQGEEGGSNLKDALSQLVPTGDPKLNCHLVKVPVMVPIESGNIQIPWDPTKK